MKRLDVFLTLVVLLCALAVVQVRDRSRLQFMDKESLDKEARELEVEWGRLQLELGSLASHSRVDQLARKELGLVPVALDKIVLLSAAPQAVTEAQP
ncbi:MAG TPA: cell division protein FtsL [Thiobacillaceae bacterium]|nr:cell division protein FtsL [Thiobacillaceae bacterium]